MKKRILPWAIWSLWALTVVLALSSLLLLYLNGMPVAEGWYLTGFITFATVGALISSHRPEHPIGWIALTVGVCFIISTFAMQYAVYTLVMKSGSLPFGSVMAWLGTGWLASLGWGLMVTLLLLLFPTGQLPSPHWRPIARLALGLVLFHSLLHALHPGPIDERYPSLANPLGIEGAGNIFYILPNILYPLLLPIVLASILSVVLRFRRAHGAERKQLEWFAYAGLLLIVAYGINILLPLLSIPNLEWIRSAMWALATSALPAAIGIAILRHRLYDIDIIINRTLVYGLLTSALALVYFGSVVTLQSLLRPLIGPDAQLATVASTLAIAALFRPARKRIQMFIDKHFYRRKYDAQKTLATFGVTLRNEVELDKQAGALLTVVDETMQPKHVSLWLRESQGESGKEAL